MYSKKLTKALGILIVALMMVSMFAVTAADGNVLNVNVVQTPGTRELTVTVTIDMIGEGPVSVWLNSPIVIDGNRQLWQEQINTPTSTTITFPVTMSPNAPTRIDYEWVASYDGMNISGTFTYTKPADPTPSTTPTPTPSTGGIPPRPSATSSGGPITVISPTPGGPTTPVTDVRQIYDDVVGQNVDWAFEAFVYLYNKGIMVGDGARHVRPNENVTREEFVTLLVKSFGYDMNVPSAGFEDVYDDTWYAPYVNAAYHAGVVLGVSDTEFGTGQNITRQDMCVLIYRAMEKAGKQLAVGSISGYTDADLIADYAQDAIGAMSAAGILTGTDGGRFDPTGFATRAQAARVIYLVIK